MFKQDAVERLDAEIMRYGFTKSRNEHGKNRWNLRCAQCGKTAEIYRPDLNNAEQLVTHFTSREWVLARDVPPYHSTPCYRAAKAAKKQENAMPPDPAPSTPIPGPQPDPKVLIRMVTLLNQHFDGTTGRYEEGWNDERVAKDANALLSFVIKYRSEGIAELAEHPDLVKLRQEIKTLADDFALNATETSQRLADLTARLDRLATTLKATG